jgi:hypothetical protein
MPDVAAKPYKGPESYQTHDAELFFGRSAAAEELIARVLSSRITLLHAQSGAGKTSLINALLIPGLERRGWAALRALPQNEPCLSIRDAVSNGLLPALEAEASAIRRAQEALGGAASLGELLGRYDTLTTSDPRRRQLIAPVCPPGENERAVVPHFCRVLRATLEVEDYAQRFSAAAVAVGLEPLRVTAGLTVAELLGFLEQPDLREAQSRFKHDLEQQPPGLVKFFERLGSRCRFDGEPIKIALILDQFEELFTRFIDLGPGQHVDTPGLGDWRLRKSLFEELERLLAVLEAPSNEDSPPRISLRLVLSLRDEYLAQLVPTNLLRGREYTAFHLQLLEVENARLAIQEPARHFGYRYAPDCYEQIVQELTKEERFIEPAHIQVVCEKLWNTQGQRIAAITAADDALPVVEKRIFDDLRGTNGILSSYFSEVLEQLPVNERAEGLELLDALVTSSGTRNIIERTQLEAEPFRDTRRRQRILEHFVRRSIVRVEPRLGGQFAEITHEFLIRPILNSIESVLDKDNDYRAFRSALRNLRGLHGQSLAAREGTQLRRGDVAVLHRWRNEVCWDAWSTELMARSALVHGFEEGIRVWLERFAELDELRDAKELAKRLARAEANGLTLEELRFLTARREELGELGEAVVRGALRSSLLLSQANERDQVAYWTRRMVSHGT